MSKFRFRGQASILRLNTRKEGPDDAKELAVDLKFQADADWPICDHFDEHLAGFLWLDSGAVRNPMLGPLSFNHELEDYKLYCVGSTFTGVKVKKFTVAPKDGRKVLLGFSVSFKPSGDEVGQFAEYLQDDFELALEPSSEELDFEEPRPEQRAPADARITFGTDEDVMYADAVKVVLDHRRASISLVQRHLRIGYNRAARLLEAMERAGVISAMSPDGAREVLTEGAAA